MAESMESREWTARLERRRSPRTPFVVRVAYATVDAFFSEFAHNVNEGGLFIETDDPPPVDTRLALHFQLPGSDKPVRTEGRVAWIREAADGEGPAGMGIEFGDLSAADRARVNEVVRRLRAEPGTEEDSRRAS